MRPEKFESIRPITNGGIKGKLKLPFYSFHRLYDDIIFRKIADYVYHILQNFLPRRTGCAQPGCGHYNIIIKWRAILLPIVISGVTICYLFMPRSV